MKKYLYVLVFLMSMILLTACSSNGTTETTGDNTSQTSTSTSGSKELTFLSSNAIATIDPAKHTDESSTHIVINTYDPLLYPNVAEKTMEPTAHIAKEWSISEDAKVYTFTLQEGVTFQSGNPLAADDVVYSMQRMLSIKQGISWMWDGILNPENVKKIDDLTVEMTLNQPYAPFLSTLTQLFIVDSKKVKENQQTGDFGENGDYGQAYLSENSAGSGPYKIESWQRGSEMKLSYFAEYWKGWTENQVENVKYLIVSEEATRKTMIRSGEAQMADQWMSNQSKQELAKADSVVLAEDPSSQIYHVTMNTQKAPLDDINVRKAISYAFDYDTANAQILGGAAKAQGPVPLLVPGHSEEALVYDYDLEKAKEYMNKSKYKGQDLTIEYYYVSDIEEERKTGLLLQTNLKELGINVELVGVPWTQITDLTSKLETTPHMIALYDSLKYPHVDSHTYGIYHPNSKGSYRAASWYENSKVTTLLENARKEIDEEKQLEYYREVQNIVAEDAVSIFIGNPIHRLVYQNNLEGYTFVGLTGYDTSFYHFTLK